MLPALCQVVIQPQQENINNVANRIPRNRFLRNRLDPLQVSDNHLLRYYRLPRHKIMELCDLMSPEMERPTKRSHAIPILLQILIGLRFLASGGFQHLLGDIISVSQSSCSRIVNKFCSILSLHAARFICFPLHNIDFLHDIKHGFYLISGFPNVIGAVDCTHVLIKAPLIDRDAYINRKGTYSINVQAVCDAQRKILNLVVRWPGSTHDSFIWHQSNLYHLLSTHVIPDGYLLGDSGYPLQQYLLTPYRNPENREQEIYNLKHSQTRMPIECCFGLLKSRFRVLHSTGGTLLYTPEKIINIITSAVILHNICVEANVILPLNELLPFEEMPEPPLNNPENHITGNIIRDRVSARLNEI